MDVETAVYPSPFAIFAISLALLAGYSLINSLIAAGVLVFFFMSALSSSLACRQPSLEMSSADSKSFGLNLNSKVRHDFTVRDRAIKNRFSKRQTTDIVAVRPMIFVNLNRFVVPVLRTSESILRERRPRSHDRGYSLSALRAYGSEAEGPAGNSPNRQVGAGYGEIEFVRSEGPEPFNVATLFMLFKLTLYRRWSEFGITARKPLN